MKTRRLLLLLLLLMALMTSGIMIGAQPEYSADDPRWTDEDRTNDPNVCFREGSVCETEEDWRYGWCDARARAGLSPCGAPQEPSQQQSRDGGDSSSSSGGGGGSTSSSSGGGGSTSSSSGGGGSSSSSASAAAPRQTRASAPQQENTRRGNYRLGYDCPKGKVCVGHWPSGEIEVYDLDNCCWDRREAIDTFNVYD